MRRSNTHFLIALMLAIITSVQAWAETLTGSCGNYVTYSLDTESGFLKIEGTGAMYTYQLNSAAPWNSNKDCIKNVEIADGITSIGAYAFYRCKFLETVTIPNTVKSIGEYAFAYCKSLKSLTIPSSVTSIGNLAFFYCFIEKDKFINNSKLASNTTWGARLCDVEQEDGLLIRYMYADGCRPSAVSVTIPDNVKEISGNAFEDCSNLKSVTIPSSVTKIGDSAFSGCTSLANIDIPNSVTSISNGWHTFTNCKSLTSVTLPESLTNIGASMFEGCKNLTSIKIPNNVKSIESYAFNGCQSLTGITIPSSVTSISSSALPGCYFTEENLINNSSCTSTNYWGSTICDAIQDDGLIIKDGVAIKCRSFATSVTIPETVTSIASEAFKDCSNLKSVNLHENINSILSYAFLNCTSLASVEIPTSVNKIEYGAFMGCSNLSSISLPNLIKEIESYTFKGCSSLASVVIPGSVTTVYTEAFEGCSALSSVTLPKSVWYFYSKAFANCVNLQSVTCESKTPPTLDSEAFAGVPLSTATLYVPVSAVDSYKKNDQWKAFGTITRTDAEDYVEGNCGVNITWTLGLESGSLTIEGTGDMPDNSWNSSPFYSKRSSIKQVLISEGITSIGKNTFVNCDSITSVTIKGNITSIGESAFERCSKLASINLPESLTSIGRDAFYGCSSLASVTIPNSLTNMDTSAFLNCSLTSPLCNDRIFFVFYPKSYAGGYKIPEGVETIMNGAFSGCSNLEYITIPSSVTSIGDYTFTECYFTKDKFINNSKCTSQNNWGATICDVIQEDGLMIVGNTVIKCKTTATAVKIPDYIEIIRANAFQKCDLLTSVNIPMSVDSIGDYAFDGCSSLPVIDNIRYADTYMVEAIYEKGEKTSINIKEGTRFIGTRAMGGEMNGDYLTSVTIPNSVVKIGSGAFFGCYGLESITIPNSVTGIGMHAFYGCKSLSSITIPSSVSYIGEYAFGGCTFISDNFVNNSSCTSENYWGAQILEKTKDGLTISGTKVISCDKQATAVSIPDYVTEISNYAFNGCSELTSVYIPNSVTAIGIKAFEGCTSLSSLELPNSVTYIGESAFNGCSGLESVRIPENLTSIYPNVFSGCTGLKSLAIPTSVTYIANSAFMGCAALKTLTIPNTVTNLGDNAFQNCSGITSLTISNSLKSIGEYTFDGCLGLTSLIIPESVAGIGNYAFQNCSSLVSVELPETLTAIGISAFNGCTKLETLTLPSNIVFLGENFVSHCTDLYAPFAKVIETNISLKGTLHVPNGATQSFRNKGWNATEIVEDIEMDFVIASGTYGYVKWEIMGQTLKLYPASYSAAKMNSAYKENGTVDYAQYPWYEYRTMVEHVVITGLSSLGEGCLHDMSNIETLTTNTTTVNLENDKSTQELFYCFGKKRDKIVTEGSRNVTYYNFNVPSSLSKIIYTGSTFSIAYFTGGEYILMKSYSYSNDSYIRANEFHPSHSIDIHADNVTEIIAASRKSLKNTKIYLTYTGNLTSGIFKDMGDLYSLTLNGTGVATEGGVFYTLFGSAPNNSDIMYGGGGYYIPLNLKELHLMEGVTSIPELCFKNVSSLEKVYLPSTLRGVQDNAFLNCDGLTDIYVNAAMPPSAKENSFDGVNVFLCTLHVPYDSKQYYGIAKGWKDFYTIDNDADIRLTIVKNIENAGQIIGSTSYMNGEMTNITAVANGGYKFAEWTDEEGNRISDKPILSIVANASCIYRAIFVPISNTGTVKCAVSGNKLTLNLEANAQVKYYKILLYTSLEMEDVVKEITVDAFGKITTRAANDRLNVEISDLENSTNYYYRIVGYDADEKIIDVFVGSFETTEETAINVVLEENNEVMGIYNIRGERMERMTRGINIIRTKNGPKKIIMK